MLVNVAEIQVPAPSKVWNCKFLMDKSSLFFQQRNYEGKIKTCLAFYTSVYKIQCQTVSYEKLCQIDLVCTNMRTNVDSKRATLW